MLYIVVKPKFTYKFKIDFVLTTKLYSELLAAENVKPSNLRLGKPWTVVLFHGNIKFQIFGFKDIFVWFWYSRLLMFAIKSRSWRKTIENGCKRWFKEGTQMTKAACSSLMIRVRERKMLKEELWDAEQNVIENVEQMK